MGARHRCNGKYSIAFMNDGLRSNKHLPDEKRQGLQFGKSFIEKTRCFDKEVRVVDGELYVS